MDYDNSRAASQLDGESGRRYLLRKIEKRPELFLGASSLAGSIHV
ncbi:MAG: hypothetical protein QOF22_2186 [Bradyrhizobium sp.]|jgi:hypothetical protein|nr:hypothetical protein [Bradyrhizobium sp.]